jgi:uncharacterized protein (DUF111 family)
MKISKIGYGSGKIQSEYPNVLRVFLGDLAQKRKNETTKEKTGKNNKTTDSM